jgi:hypothetical protein
MQSLGKILRQTSIGRTKSLLSCQEQYHYALGQKQSLEEVRVFLFSLCVPGDQELLTNIKDES